MNSVVARDYDQFCLITQDTNPGFQPFGFADGLVEEVIEDSRL